MNEYVASWRKLLQYFDYFSVSDNSEGGGVKYLKIRLRLFCYFSPFGERRDLESTTNQVANNTERDGDNTALPNNRAVYPYCGFLF